MSALEQNLELAFLVACNFLVETEYCLSNHREFFLGPSTLLDSDYCNKEVLIQTKSWF